MENIEKNDRTQFINEFKTQWKNMWHNRLDDKVRAEGIADKNYTLLSIDRGTVIIATRKFKPLDYFELLQQHKALDASEITPPNPSVGGWRKFIRTALPQPCLTRYGRRVPTKPSKHLGQQLKKGGRGWLHLKV